MRPERNEVVAGMCSRCYHASMKRLTRAQAADLVARFERAVLRRASTKGEHQAEWYGKAEALRTRLVEQLCGEDPGLRAEIARALSGEHRCFGPKCEAVVRPTRVFCEVHFKKLPERIITQLRDAYEKHPPFNGRPSEGFLVVAERAIGELGA